jgi:hypothetical protein
MIISIHQPAYIPWLDYFERIFMSDVHVILYHVQFEKNSMVNRNKVKTSNGWVWLTVPVASKGKFGELGINNIRISNSTRWQKKHWNTICGAYSKSLFFHEHRSFFEDVYSREWNELSLLMKEITIYLLNVLSIKTKIIRSSELNLSASNSDLVLEIVNQLGATDYLSGPFGRDYLDMDKFQEENVKVQFHDYTHPIYHQLHGDFCPYMSIIDLLFNEGPKSLGILTGMEN